MAARGKTITGLPAATVPLSGDEEVPLSQFREGAWQTVRAPLSEVIPLASPVSSVAGRTGAVTLGVADISDFEDAWQAATAVALGRVLPSYFGITIPDDGETDASAALNQCFAAAVAAGKRLYVPKAATYYRLASTLYMLSNLDLECHPQAEFVAHFTTLGSGAIFGMTSAAWSNVNLGIYLEHIRIKGGIWRRYGEIDPADDTAWIGNRGNVFCFWAVDVAISDLVIPGYSGGRAFLWGGRHTSLDRVRVWNLARPDLWATNRSGGTGGFRLFSGLGPHTITRCYGVCGDDVFQAVPGATDSIGEDLADFTYSDCWGISTTARLCVVGLVVPNRMASDLQNSQTMGIRSGTFRGIRGRGTIAVANEDSTGILGTILFDDVKFSAIKEIEGASEFSYAVDIGGANLTSGAGPIHFRDCEVIRMAKGGVRCRGTQINQVTFTNWRQPAPDDPTATEALFWVQDAQRLELCGGQITGGAGGTKNIITLGATGVTTDVRYTLIEDVEIAGIPAGGYGIFGPTYGFTELDVVRVKMTPLEGVTTARAIRFSESTTRAMIDNCDLTAIGSTPFVNVKPGVRWRDTRFSIASVLVQSTAAAASIEWDGRSPLIRLSANAATTIDTISVPAGWPIDRVPEIVLRNISAHTISLSGAGNIRPRGSEAALGASQALRLVQDPVDGLWFPLSSASPVAEGATLLSVVAAGYLPSSATVSRAQSVADATYEAVDAGDLYVSLVSAGELSGIATVSRPQSAAVATMEAAS
jgi:hypothetical protein